MPHPIAPQPLPDDHDGWAELAADARAPEKNRRGAFERLTTCIEGVARRVSVRFAGRREDFCAGVLGDVWEVIGRFPAGANFEAWCYIVLHNRWTDLTRWEQCRESQSLLGHPEPSAPDIRAALERGLDSAAIFGDDDLREIRAWPLRDRVVLLCLASLWRKVPDDEWQGWVRDHRAAHGTPASDPFPPDSLDRGNGIADQNALLARELDLRRNTLSVILHRGKVRLGVLRYVRDLMGPDGGRP
ncbi:hypothetical protein GobsT_13050 [Gemmata obscuriglobus]|uniref:Sigma-70 family RNA polymerase sigma factor n=1 Tax=Gemmata obscuriglobus TaxID=114 RepID=A0A2Z3H5R2_9BACT|nr:sigma-70 family RNA polymerase sigma factor [Gemmata obscuriglobus]QEG26564.1 hypothetical protein GobsT_13050 [Gemmata obscuriglobus]VTS01979.1 hypothetical protein : Uncharacterized protein OS=Isosphaera pallida (strain ATCC 43644 / DSM 9630 / IS1B) GN=Isop_1009 PE=4 SV=1 [Gemmata obscuriglobus UQM 2246]